jgi:hypothetical protein
MPDYTRMKSYFFVLSIRMERAATPLLAAPAEPRRPGLYNPGVLSAAPTTRPSRRRVGGFILLLLLVSAACRKTEPITHEKVRGMIEASLVFQAKLDEDVALLDTRLKDNPNMKREVVSIDALTSKPDGPFGMAGETATVVFTWRWNEGPLARTLYRTRAKLHGDGEGWTLYEDTLQKGLRASISGEE